MRYEIHLPDGTVFGPWDVTQAEARQQVRNNLGRKRLPNGTRLVRVAEKEYEPPPGPFRVEPVRVPRWTPKALEHAGYGEVDEAREAMAFDTHYNIVCSVTGRVRGSRADHHEAETQAEEWNNGN